MATDKTYHFEDQNTQKTNRSSKAIKVLTFFIVFAALVIAVVIGVLIGSRNGVKQGEEIVSDMYTTEPTTYEPETLITEKYRVGDYIVTGADELRLRDEHSTNGNMLIAVPKNARITVSDVYYDATASLELQYWGLTSYLGHSGWIALYYTENAYSSSVVESLTEEATAVPAEATTAGTQRTVTKFVPGDYVVNADTGLRIRESYSVESEMVALIPNGAEITITEVYEDATAETSLRYWGKVTYMNCSGWISMFYLENIAEETTAAPATTVPSSTASAVTTTAAQ